MSVEEKKDFKLILKKVLQEENLLKDILEEILQEEADEQRRTKKIKSIIDRDFKRFKKTFQTLA